LALRHSKVLTKLLRGAMVAICLLVGLSPVRANPHADPGDPDDPRVEHAAPTNAASSAPSLLASPAANVAWRETEVGGIATPTSWALYSSSTYAPFGAVDRDGVRLRVGSAYGQYTYKTSLPAQGDCRYGTGQISTIRGRQSFAELLGGYQTTVGGWTIKAFAGVARDEQALNQRDMCNAASGQAIGVKSNIETWANLTPSIWLATDASWAAPHASYYARGRLAYRLNDTISLGLEETRVGNRAGNQHRSGVFGRMTWSWGEASLAGGIARPHVDFRNVSSDDVWAQISVLIRY
jgi:Cellulose biosynthesis protein BcsS